MTAQPFTSSVRSPGRVYAKLIKGHDFDGNVETFDATGFKPLKARSSLVRGTTYTSTGNGCGSLVVWTVTGKPAGLRYTGVPGWKVGALHGGFKRKRIAREPTSDELQDALRRSLA